MKDEALKHGWIDDDIFNSAWSATTEDDNPPQDSYEWAAWGYKFALSTRADESNSGVDELAVAGLIQRVVETKTGIAAHSVTWDLLEAIRPYLTTQPNKEGAKSKPSYTAEKELFLKRIYESISRGQIKDFDTNYRMTNEVMPRQLHSSHEQDSEEISMSYRKIHLSDILAAACDIVNYYNLTTQPQVSRDKNELEKLKRLYQESLQTISTLRGESLLQQIEYNLQPQVNREAVERVARAIAISIYHSEGLETMNYTGELNYADREWTHYEKQAQAAVAALQPPTDKMKCGE